MKRLLILLVITTSLYCCGQDNPVYKQEAIEMNNKAGGYLQNGKVDSALILFDKAIKMDETYMMPHSNKVNIYLNRKEFDKAMLENETIVSKQPEMAEAWSFLGMLYSHLGYHKKANLSYSKSIDLYSARINDKGLEASYMSNRLNRAVSYILIGEVDKGKAELKQLKTEDPNNPIVDQMLQFSKDDLIKQVLGL